MVQLPASDIDLLVVHDDAAIATTVDALLYPLWDAGLAVGHAVRSPAECLAATERFDAWTAMLDGRLVAGDETLAERALAPVRARAREDPGGFARRLRDAAGSRRRSGPTSRAPASSARASARRSTPARPSWSAPAARSSY